MLTRCLAVLLVLLSQLDDAIGLNVNFVDFGVSIQLERFLRV